VLVGRRNCVGEEVGAPEDVAIALCQRSLVAMARGQWDRADALADSFAAFVGHPAYNTGALCADLHRLAFLLGASDGEELLDDPAP
jgi:hypothetical protein